MRWQSVSDQTSSTLRSYFDRAADGYTLIEAAFLPLARELVAFAALKPNHIVLDLGTGTGLVAGIAASSAGQVIALDFSSGMLTAALRRGITSAVRADMHRLAIRPKSIDLALASFAFNSTDYRRAFVEVRRILTPPGRLVFQEWGAPDEMSERASDIIAAYMVDDPPDDLADMRASMELPLPWDELENAGDIIHALGEAGFVEIEGGPQTSGIEFPDAETFIRYKLAWPNRRAELAAMPDDVRHLCIEELRESLAAYTEADGRLIWRPEVIRLSAGVRR